MSAQERPTVAGEFHPISVILLEDFTDVVCSVCGALQRTSSVARGADHALVTGHTVTERHVVINEIREAA